MFVHRELAYFAVIRLNQPPPYLWAWNLCGISWTTGLSFLWRFNLISAGMYHCLTYIIPLFSFPLLLLFVRKKIVSKSDLLSIRSICVKSYSKTVFFNLNSIFGLQLFHILLDFLMECVKECDNSAIHYFENIHKNDLLYLSIEKYNTILVYLSSINSKLSKGQLLFYHINLNSTMLHNHTLLKNCPT